MNALITESRRRLLSFWFFFTIFLTLLTLYSEKRGDVTSLTLLSLPLLSALPASSAVQKELSNGYVRPVVFRIGMKRYLLSRLFSLLISSMLAQLAAVLLFIPFSKIRFLMVDFSFMKVLARMLTAGVFALLGSMGAVLTHDTACAYVMPMVLCFSLSLIRSRFLPEKQFLDPVRWLSGEGFSVLIPGSLFVLSCFVFLFYITKKVKQYV